MTGMRRLPLLVDVFADRTVSRAALTAQWCHQRGIPLPPHPSKDDLARAAENAGYFVKGNASLSIPSTAVVPDASGTTTRDRAVEILRHRRLVVGFDYTSKVCQPFAIHIVPPLTKADEAIITGRPPPKDGHKVWFGRVQLLTETAKMGCYSWNLPAGPPKLGGTCPSAALAFMYSTAEDAQRQGGNVLAEPDVSGKGAYRLDAATHPVDYGTFICNGCYALKGNYRNGNQIVMMVVRQMLVQTLLKGTGALATRGVSFVDGDAYHRAREAGAKPTQAVRAADAAGESKEIHCGGQDGVRSLAWLLKTAILCANIFSREMRKRRLPFDYTRASYQTLRAFYENAVREAEAAPQKKKTTPQEQGRAHTEAAWAWAIPDPGYFRIHDSGDYFSLDYWHAWELVMRELPGMRFWAPNRTWAHRSHTVEHERIPENLAMRPSALHFGDPPPSVAAIHSIGLPTWHPTHGGGLAAGSGSGDPSRMHRVEGTPFHAFHDLPEEHFWECPAYAYWTQGGGAVFGSEDRPAGGTCILARGPNGEKGCRACWGGEKGEYTHIGVVYHEH